MIFTIFWIFLSRFLIYFFLYFRISLFSYFTYKTRTHTHTDTHNTNTYIIYEKKTRIQLNFKYFSLKHILFLLVVAVVILLLLLLVVAIDIILLLNYKIFLLKSYRITFWVIVTHTLILSIYRKAYSKQKIKMKR